VGGWAAQKIKRQKAKAKGAKSEESGAHSTLEVKHVFIFAFWPFALLPFDFPAPPTRPPLNKVLLRLSVGLFAFSDFERGTLRDGRYRATSDEFAFSIERGQPGRPGISWEPGCFWMTRKSLKYKAII
jgi:hypothetical protein